MRVSSQPLVRIVDDDQHIRTMLGTLLALEGYAVITARCQCQPVQGRPRRRRRHAEADRRRRAAHTCSSLGRTGSLASAAGPWTIGIVKKNVLPFPGWLSTQMRPPCPRTMHFEM